MRYLALALVLVGVVTAARAQDAIPDLKGTWSGKEAPVSCKCPLLGVKRTLAGRLKPQNHHIITAPVTSGG